MDNWNEHDPAWLIILVIILPFFSFWELIMAMEYTREALVKRFPKIWLLLHWCFVLIPVTIGLHEENILPGIAMYCVMSPLLAIMLWGHKRSIKTWKQNNYKQESSSS